MIKKLIVIVAAAIPLVFAERNAVAEGSDTDVADFSSIRKWNPNGEDAPTPHDPSCGTIVYSKTNFTNIYFSNNPGTGGADGWLFDKITLGGAPDLRRVCSIEGAFAANEGAAYGVTLRVYSECPVDTNNGGACFAAPQLLAEVAGPQNLTSAAAWAVDFDFPTPILVPDTIWVGYRITGNPIAGPLAAGPDPTIGTSVDADMAICSSNGTTASTCAYNVTPANGTNDNFYFRVGALSTTVCSVPPAPGSTPENEPDCGEPDDVLNGGCNSTPPVFQAISSGQTIAGTVGTLNNQRDQDWFEFTVPSGHSNLSMTVNAEFSLSIVLLNGVCPATVMKAVAGAPCAPTTLSHCVPAGTYHIIVQPATFTGVTCGARYNATFTASACTPNPPTDFCVDATSIGVGATPFSTVGASSDGPLLMTGCAGNHVNDVWFKHTATETGDLTINTCDAATTYDTTLTVYDGCDCSNLFEMGNGCNQNTVGCNTVPAPGGLGSSVTVFVTQGNCYLIRVGSPGIYSDPVNNSGAGVLNLSLPCPNTNTCGGVLGDLNSDTIADGKDIQGFVNCWITGPCVANGCECADMDFDLDLQSDDLTDFINLLLQ